MATLKRGFSRRYDCLMILGLRYGLRLPCNRVPVRWNSWYVTNYIYRNLIYSCYVLDSNAFVTSMWSYNGHLAFMLKAFSNILWKPSKGHGVMRIHFETFIRAYSKVYFYVHFTYLSRGLTLLLLFQLWDIYLSCNLVITGSSWSLESFVGLGMQFSKY